MPPSAAQPPTPEHPEPTPPAAAIPGASGVPEVSAAQAGAMVADGALLLDVRELDEWEAGHAPQAAHMPLGALQAEHERLPRDRQIVAVCRVGGRSAMATAALRGAGYEVVNLDGGMQAWEAASLPVVDDRGHPGQVI